MHALKQELEAQHNRLAASMNDTTRLVGSTHERHDAARLRVHGHYAHRRPPSQVLCGHGQPVPRDGLLARDHDADGAAPRRPA